MTLRPIVCASLLVLMPLAARAAEQGPAGSSARLPLAAGWAIQSSAKVSETGEVLSTPQFRAKDWYPATVPTTVVATLIKNKVYPDPYFGKNLLTYPGMDYPIGKNFSKFPMKAGNPFMVPWWYRTQFTLPAGYKGKTIWLNFAGVNYRADIFLNGKQIIRSEEIAGALRMHELNITALAKPGAANALAVRVYAPTETDLAITFVDWNPATPDKMMGLWREVFVTTSGPVAVRYPTVISKVNSPANDAARLTVTALVKNGTTAPVKGTLKGRIESIAFEQPVELAAGESKDVTFEPAQYAALEVSKPRLWWPAQMGTPNLYDLEMRFEVDGKLADRTVTKFGIREITSDLNENKKRFFTINGKKILVRGAGWTSDMLLTDDPGRMRDQIRYVKDLGLNTIRLEGKLEPDPFFDITDREGILVMAGWCCCDHWEHWDRWKPQDHVIAKASARDQIYRMRSRPSLLMWLNGSDFPPPPQVEKMYLDIQKELRWPNPVVSSATAKATPVSGESGVKMSGPYEWVPPSYWLRDKTRGGAYGFNSETSSGPAPPPIETLKRMFPPDKLWPMNDHWAYHSGGDVFTDIKYFGKALDSRLGKAESAEDFALKSQVMTYEGIRAMFEAYSRNKYVSTGVIQWMLNNAWPGLIWHLYDYYLRPGGGYFGAKKVCGQKLHPMYGYDDNGIWLVSSQYEDTTGLKLTARVFNLDMTEKFSQTVTVDAPADSTNKVLALPAIKDLSSVYFVHLTLDDAAGKRIGSNLYWLSTKEETMNWEKSEWFVTPTSSYADFTALAKLPKVRVKVSSKNERKGEEGRTRVTLENPSKDLAFFIRLKVNGKGGEEVLPVIWEDNYISLLPGEKREVSATYRARDVGGAKPVVEVSGWNVTP